MLTMVDFFAGIGTMRMGFEQAGHECVYSIEWDKHKRGIYNVIFGKEPEGRDIRTVRADDIPRADCWAFGAPCQDFSISGSRKGLNGDRSSLVREVFRLVRETKEEYRPKWLLYENVRGMFSSNKGFDFLKILSEMESLGYDRIEYSLLNTKQFGLPQNRERVYVIGHLRGRSGAKVFPINGIQTSGKIKIKSDVWMKFQNRNTPDKIEVIKYLRSNKQKTNSQIATEINIPLTQIEHYFRLDESGALPNGEDWMKLKKCLDFDNTYDEAMTTYFDDYYKYDMSGRLYELDGIAPTLTTISGGHQVPFINTPKGIRELTPREFWRLQGIEENIINKVIAANISNAQMYKGAGDSCSVPVVYEIAKRLV
jgi:DNA (cytosine-5)-methyltransferase 1